jgi:hypothetical protein
MSRTSLRPSRRRWTRRVCDTENQQSPNEADESLAQEMVRVERDCEKLSECAQWTHRVSRYLFQSDSNEKRAECFWALFHLTARGDGVRAWLGFVHGVYDKRITESELRSLYEGAFGDDRELIRLLLMADDTGYVRARRSEFAYDPVLDSVTLGERKSMARKMDLDLLERLAKDADPSVIRIMLANPRLTEPLVLRMVALRPHREGVLCEFGRQAKWLNKAQVRRALVLNPYTPVRLGMMVSPLLGDVFLREASQARNLHPGLRRLVRGLLSIRPHPKVFKSADDVSLAHDLNSEIEQLLQES